MKILPMEAELFYADGQTGTTKLIVAFRNFANAPIGTYLLCIKLQIWRWESVAMNFLQKADAHGSKYINLSEEISPRVSTCYCGANS